MALVTVVNLPHFQGTPIYASVFKDVQNADFLRQQLLEGNTDFEYAFLDASVVLSEHHILAACFRAVNDLLNQRLKSRNVHSEIVFSLSPNNNIAESFRRFGISGSTKALFAIKVATDPSITKESVSAHLGQHVKGTCVNLSEWSFEDFADVARLKKIYKFTPARNASTKSIPQASGEFKELEAFILGTMALKGS